MCDGRDLGTAIGERPPAPDSGTELVEAQHAAPLQGASADRGDDFAPSRLRDASSSKLKEFFEPNLYLYDAYPGGIGFSEPLYRAHELLIHKTRELISACVCDEGCPSCVGPAGDLAPRAKEAALAILDRLCD